MSIEIEIAEKRIEIDNSVKVSDCQLGIGKENMPMLELSPMAEESGVIVKNISDRIFVWKRVINNFTFSTFRFSTDLPTFRVESHTRNFAFINVEMKPGELTIWSYVNEPLLLWMDLCPDESIHMKMYDKLFMDMQGKPLFTILKDDLAEWELMPWRLEWEENVW